MTITQLIQSSPANANELFAKLAATTNGAGKTREALFSELKAELEMHSRLEEQHIFPALRKHKETKALVQEAIADNKRTRALVEELEAMPKQGEEFLGRLADLRKVFQQHVRDEKKELLPAVMQALSTEEMQTISEKVEAEKAAAEEAKRQEAEDRRTAARQEREEAERRQVQAEARKQRALEKEQREETERRAEARRIRNEEKQRQEEAEAEHRSMREAGTAVARTGQTVINEAQSSMASGAAAAQASVEVAVRSSQAVTEAISDSFEQTSALVARSVQNYSDHSQPAIDQIEAFATLPPAATAVAAEAGKVWFELLGRSARSSARRSRDLMHAFTPFQIAEAHSRYFDETRRAWSEANTRMLDISFEAYRSMLHGGTVGAEQGTE